MSRTVSTAPSKKRRLQDSQPGASEAGSVDDVEHLNRIFEQQQKELLKKQQEIMERVKLQQMSGSEAAASGTLSPGPSGCSSQDAAAEAIAPPPPIVIQPVGSAGDADPSDKYAVPLIPAFGTVKVEGEAVKKEKKVKVKEEFDQILKEAKEIMVTSGSQTAKTEPKSPAIKEMAKKVTTEEAMEDSDFSDVPIDDMEDVDVTNPTKENQDQGEDATSNEQSPRRSTRARSKIGADQPAAVIRGKARTLDQSPVKLKATARKTMPQNSVASSSPKSTASAESSTKSSDTEPTKPAEPSRKKLTARKSTAKPHVVPQNRRKAAGAANAKIKKLKEDLDSDFSDELKEDFDSDLSDVDESYDPAKDKSDDSPSANFSPRDFHRGPGRPPKYLQLLNKKPLKSPPLKPTNIVNPLLRNEARVPKPPPSPPDHAPHEENRGPKIKVAAVNLVKLGPSGVNKLRQSVKEKQELPEHLLKTKDQNPHQAPKRLRLELFTPEDVDDDEPPPSKLPKCKPGPSSRKPAPVTKEEELFAYDDTAGIACREGDGKVTLPISVIPSKNKCSEPRFRTLFIGTSGNLKNKWLKVIMKDINGEPTNQCLTCCFSSSDPVEVAYHEEEYHQDKFEHDASVNKPGQNQLFMECRHCDYVTTDRLCLWFHFKKYHRVPKLLKCSYKLNNTAYIEFKMPHLTAFLQNHSKEMYKCPVEGCKQMSIQAKFVVLHVLKEHITEKDIVFPGYVKITQEKRTNQNSDAVPRDVFICVECMYVTQGLAHMNTHNYSLHSNKHLLYLCKYCNAQFVNSQKTMLHCTKEHEGKQPCASITIIKKKCMEDTWLTK